MGWITLEEHNLISVEVSSTHQRYTHHILFFTDGDILSFYFCCSNLVIFFYWVSKGKAAVLGLLGRHIFATAMQA